MQIKLEILWLAILTIDVCTCQTESVNGTLTSRREVLEKQALEAYQNACYGLQELSNWMSVVFKMKSVWTGSTINQLEKDSGKTLEVGEKKFPPLPPRPKTAELGCSFRNAQVTLQTYAQLQRQLLHLKTILGRNMVKTSSIKLTDANISIRERIKVLDVFNDTINDIFNKLKKNTQELISQNPNARNFNEGGFLKYLQIPVNIFLARQATVNPDGIQPKAKGFFQHLGKTLDKMIFSTEASKLKNNFEENTRTIEKETEKMQSKNEAIDVEKVLS